MAASLCHSLQGHTNVHLLLKQSGHWAFSIIFVLHQHNILNNINVAENSLLQQLYADLSNDQITYKLLHESDQLTAEAIQVAKDELAKRHINFELLETAKEQEQQQQKKYEQFRSVKNDTEVHGLLNAVIEAKINGKSSAEIINDFEKLGIEKDVSLALIKEAKQQCSDSIDNTRADLFYGGMIAAAGIILTIFVRRISNSNVVFFPYGAILYGVIRLLKGLANLSAQKKIKEIIKQF
jgi:uncharacterized protein YajQ (UPF0234 family)